MKVELDREGTFIPTFNGNRNLSEMDKIIVRYKNPTLSIINRCRKKPKAKGIANASGGIDHMEITIEKDDVATIRELLVSVGNCSYVMDGKETHIVNANDLFNAPVQFSPLYKEIVEEFDRILDNAEINEKN